MRDLLTFIVDGSRYGVWKDRIHSIKGIDELHALPLASSWVAGVANIEGRTVTLLDIAACIGFAPPRGNSGITALLTTPDGEPFGFAIRGRTEVVAVPPEACMAMPGRIKTPIMETCAVVESAAVPILELSTIGELALSSTAGAPGPRLSSAERRPSGSRKPEDMRLFSSGGFIFALPAGVVLETTSGADPICRLPCVPAPLKGIAVRRGRALPVIDLAEHMAERGCAAGAPLLLAAEGDEAIGLLIDEDRGVAKAKKCALIDLPPLVRTPELPAVVVSGGTISLFLDTMEMLVSVESAAIRTDPYTPDSKFSSTLTRQEVKVLEFQFCGIRFALPSSEVEDIVGCRPFHGVPKAPGIVRGIAELHGEMLPVLDLAAAYGRRTDIDQSRDMILVGNGDFRALVAGEALFGERTLGIDVQRRLPVTPPYEVVYGCYTEVNGVRLILNTEALAVYFDDSEVAEFLSALPAALHAAIQPEEIPQPRIEVVDAAEPVVPDQLDEFIPLMESEEPLPDATITEPNSAQDENAGFSAASAAPVPSSASAADLEQPALRFEAPEQPSAPAPESAATFVDTRIGRETAARSAPGETADARRGSKRTMSTVLASMAIAVILAALGFIFLKMRQKPPEGSAQTSPSELTGETPPAGPEIQLELEVPADMPIESEYYIVVKGDTLWDIAFRFTGNPRNYPRIAGENKIADPDLIFPGQRIKLIRKNP